MTSGDDVWSYIVRRTQIYLDDEQDRWLGERAELTGRTKSDLIREAIDRFSGRDAVRDDDRLAHWRDALEATAGIAPDLPSGVEYVTRLRAADRDREQQADQRRGH
ncbi:MAG: CopG family transcriptional regulator [Acidimicrobiia bacterium]